MKRKTRRGSRRCHGLTRCREKQHGVKQQQQQQPAVVWISLGGRRRGEDMFGPRSPTLGVLKLERRRSPIPRFRALREAGVSVVDHLAPNLAY